MLLRKGLAAGVLLGSVSAQSSTTSADETVISVFMIGAVGGGPEDNPDKIYASIVDNDDTATTMEIGCDQTREDETCNFFSGFQVINGPSTFEAGYQFNNQTMTMGCEITDSSTATCSQTIIGQALMIDEGGPDARTQTDADTTAITTTSTTTTLAPSEVSYYPVTITAGALKTGDESDAASSSAGASASSTGASGSSDAGRLALSAPGALVGLVALGMMML